MSVLALEFNRDQAEAIRQACALADTTVTVVENAGDLLAALQVHPPTLVLLPPLVTAVDEAAVVERLRSSPHLAHVEVLMTPLLASAPEERSGRRWLRRSGRRSTNGLPIAADAASFAERLRWSLACARQRRIPNGVQTGDMVAAEAAPEQMVAVSSTFLGMLGEVIAETGHDLHGLQLADTATHLIRKLDDDRRTHRRFAAHELKGLRGARIKFGPRVALLDVSAGGALLESDSRLQPDTEGMLELAGGDGKILVPIRVLRSHVAALNGSPRYRGACAFKSLLNVDDLLMGAGMLRESMALVAPPHLQVCNAW